MSYAGHVIDMIKRLENNRRLQKDLRKGFGNKPDAYKPKVAHKEFNQEKFRSHSDEGTDQKRDQIRNETILNYKLAWIKGTLTLLAIILLSALLILLF